MPKVSFTKADLERAVSAALAAGLPVGEVRIEKTASRAHIRILSAGSSPEPEPEDDALHHPEPW